MYFVCRSLLFFSPKTLDIIKSCHMFQVDLRHEWSIWSKCFGKVIVINGVSSTGKTTLAGYLEQFGFNRMTVDDVYKQCYMDYLSGSIVSDLVSKVKSFSTQSDLWKILMQFRIDATRYTHSEQEYISELRNYLRQNNEYIFQQCPSEIEIYDMLYNKAKKFIFAGLNVVIDVVMTIHENTKLLSYCFNNYPITMVLLYLPLEENLKQCFIRNYISEKYDLVDTRLPSQILRLYSLFYKCVSQHDIKYNDIKLTKVNKSAIVSILEYSVRDSEKLLHQVYNDDVYSEKMTLFHKSIEHIHHFMDLKSDEELFIVPLAKSDFIISGFKLRHKVLNYFHHDTTIDLSQLIALNLESDVCGNWAFLTREASVELSGVDPFTSVEDVVMNL